jgi:AcrR family transcriptional regulator
MLEVVCFPHSDDLYRSFHRSLSRQHCYDPNPIDSTTPKSDHSKDSPASSSLFFHRASSSVWIERISAYSFAYRADGHAVRNDSADVAVLAIPAANLASGSNNTGPRRSCGSLRNGLPLEGRLTLRCKLLSKEAFTRSGSNTSLDDIAKQAASERETLYRHFPTRDALLEAVYRTELEKLAAAERKFAQTMPPIEALRAWMLLFVDYIATKQIIAPALNTLVGGPSKVFEASGAQIKGAIHTLVERVIESGDIRPDDAQKAREGGASVVHAALQRLDALEPEVAPVGTSSS